MKGKNKERKWIFWFSLGIAIIAVYKLLDNFSQITSGIGKLFNVLMPFIVGLIIAYLFYVPCKKIEGVYDKIKLISKKSRLLSVVTVYIIAILLLILILNFAVPTISRSIVDFVNNFGNYYNNVVNKINELPEDSIWKSQIILNIVKNISEVDLKQFINISKLTEYAKGAINIVNSIFDIFVSFIVSVYLLVERRNILSFLKRLSSAIFKNSTFNVLEKYFNKLNEVFFKFISGQVLDAIVIGTMTSIAMYIIGVKYAGLLGFMIGLFNLIPYFGAIIAVTAAIIITIFTGGIGKAIVMTAIVIILQQIDANIINPKIIGNSLSISPLLVIFAVTIGGAYLGIIGMFLAVPIFTIIKLLIEEYIEYKKMVNMPNNNPKVL